MDENAVTGARVDISNLKERRSACRIRKPTTSAEQSRTFAPMRRITFRLIGAGESSKNAMSQFYQSRPPRSPRVDLRGQVSATIRLENGRQLFGKLHRLSVTGGLLEVANCVEERIWVGLTIYLASGTVRPRVEMMFPMVGAAGYLQPFRIVRISDEEHRMLEAEIGEHLRRAIAPGKPGHGAGFRPPRFYLESF